MSNPSVAALTAEQWEARDYRQSAHDLDSWAQGQEAKEDTTEYVAKLGLSDSGSVIAMNRAHDRVLIPPPARAALAAFALAEQPFGFTRADIDTLLKAAERAEGQDAASALRDLGQRIQALVPATATLIALMCIGSTSGLAQRPPAPIIDMHLHAGPADAQGTPPMRICAPLERMATRDPGQSAEEYAAMMRQQRGCRSPLVSATTDAELLENTLEVLRRRNIYAVTSGPWEWVQRWHAAAPDRFIQGLAFHVYNAPIDSVRKLVESGQLKVMGEVLNQFVGVAPGDSTFEPYLALAEARDIPVGIHIGPGPQGAFYRGAKGYRASLAHPQLLEEVLVRHPRLRIYVMHAGWPMLDEMLLMLYSHPQLYVDLGLISFAIPRDEFYFYLRRLVQAGFGERIMFGSDQMVWPQAIERAIAAVDSAPFLGPEQKRNIFYNNAARFLRLSAEEVARQHGGL